MTKFLALLFVLATLVILGCTAARKIPGKHGFYSTKSPSLSIEFNGLEYQGEFKESKGSVSVHTYYYLDPDGNQGAWVELINMRQDWELQPKKVPGAKQPNSGIYTREIAGDNYYCRTFIVTPSSGQRGFAAMPSYTAIRICTKLISSKKKISIGYAGEVDAKQAEKLFSAQSFNQLTQAQIDFFAAFNEKADAALIMRKFRKGDVQGKIETAEKLKNPWYRFTDFLPLKQVMGKIQR